jgi:hypothetical protein
MTVSHTLFIPSSIDVDGTLWRSGLTGDHRCQSADQEIYCALRLILMAMIYGHNHPVQVNRDTLAARFET